MDAGLIGLLMAAGCVVDLWLLVCRARRKARHEEEESGSCGPAAEGGRRFSLAELKGAESGRYSWDETGCVFEINSDGSVTIVGCFDPAELVTYPVQEQRERLEAEGLWEMLPRLWSFMAPEEDGARVFVMAAGDVRVSARAEGAEMANFEHEDAGDVAPMVELMCEAGAGDAVLLPGNEMEFVLSLGAQACIRRIFEGRVEVRISSPAVAGAFGTAAGTGKVARISFAYGDGDEYRCCNMLADNGVCTVRQLLTASIIHAATGEAALHRIARGCMALSLGAGRLMDVLPYGMRLVLREGDRAVKVYGMSDGQQGLPFAKEEMGIRTEGRELSFLIGDNVIVGDVPAECGSGAGPVDAGVECGEDMTTYVTVRHNGQSYKINIGELIG